MKIKVENLKKSFNEHVLFENYSFEIKEGAITCIYGKSGSGKTTLLNILGLIEKYDHGEITYDGKTIHSNKKRREYLSKRIGFVFQNFALIETETVYENLKILKRLKKKTRDKEIEEALEKFGLEGYQNRKVYELSGGEQQRVALAKVYLKQCDLILADEPTASLDEENKQKVLKVLKEFSQNGKTVIIVTHDHSVFEYCDEWIKIGE